MIDAAKCTLMQVLAPLPGAHRALVSPACLPHIVQVYGRRVCKAHVQCTVACTDQVVQSCQCSVGISRPEVVADLVQLMATGEPSLVAGAAALLETVLRHDSDILPRLYTTGAFFFALAYCGSNLLEIARLLRVSVWRGL